MNQQLRHKHFCFALAAVIFHACIFFAVAVAGADKDTHAKEEITLPNVELMHPSVIKYVINKLPFSLNPPVFSMNGESEYDHHADKIFRTVHPPGLYINIADAWLGSGNAATFSGLAPPNKIQIPIRLNIVFIGFLNDRDEGVPKDNLRSWFEHLQDKVTHTVVEHPKDYARPKHLGAETDVLEYIYKFHTFDLSSAVANAIEQVFKAKSIYDEKSDMMVLQVSEIESLLESLLKKMSKKSSLAHGYTFFILNLQELDLRRPKGSKKVTGSEHSAELKHGYRDGFSESYIKTIAESPTLKKMVLNALKASNRALDFDDFMEDSVFPANAAPKPQRGHFMEHSLKNGAINVKKITEDWAQKVVHETNYKRGSLQSMQDSPENLARKILASNDTISSLTREKLLDAIVWARSKEDLLREATNNVGANKVGIDQTSCIVDAGISNHRFGWVDLSAGPFAYGPTIGGSGVRTEHTFPRVPEFPPLYNSHPVESKHEHPSRRRQLLAEPERGEKAKVDIDDTKDDIDFLHSMDAPKLIQQLDEMEHAILVINQLMKASCAKTEDGITPINEVDCYRYTMKMKESVRNRDIFANAVDVLSGKKHAASGKELSVNDMRRAHMEAQEAWKNFHYNSAGGLGHREGKNNTDTYGAGPMGPAEVRQVQVEHLLGHLAGTVQSFMRHVITPVSGRPVPAASSVGRHKALKKSPTIDDAFAAYYKTGLHESDMDGTKYKEIVDHMRLKASKTPGYSNDLGAFAMPPVPADRVYHSERVTFHIHIVSNHKSFDPVSSNDAHPVDSFDFHEYRRQIMMLKGADQEFSFTFQTISVENDPTLSASLQFSMSTTQVPSLSVGGHYKSERRKTIDTMSLYNRIRSLEKSDEFLHHKNMNEYARKSRENHDSDKVHPHFEDEDHNKIPSREISIFLFSIDSPLPVMLDKYFLARSLPDVVFIVQSTQRFWKGPLSCNKKPVYVNLRNPLKEALLATQATISGTLPAFVSHHGSNARPSHDWSWTIGESPNGCFTGSRAHFSDFDIDTNFRSEIVQSLLAAREMVQEGVHKLHLQRTSWENLLILRRFGYSFGWRITRLRFLHFKIMEQSKTILKMLEELRYQDALPLLNPLLHQARTFRHLVERIVEVFHPYVCKPRREDSLHYIAWEYVRHIFLVTAIVIVTFALGFVCIRNFGNSNKRRKPKLN